MVSSSNNIIRARKRCVKCGHALGGRGRAYDDVPLSWSALALAARLKRPITGTERLCMGRDIDWIADVRCAGDLAVDRVT